MKVTQTHLVTGPVARISAVALCLLPVTVLTPLEVKAQSSVGNPSAQHCITWVYKDPWTQGAYFVGEGYYAKNSCPYPINVVLRRSDQTVVEGPKLPSGWGILLGSNVYDAQYSFPGVSACKLGFRPVLGRVCIPDASVMYSNDEPVPEASSDSEPLPDIFETDDSLAAWKSTEPAEEAWQSTAPPVEADTDHPSATAIDEWNSTAGTGTTVVDIPSAAIDIPSAVDAELMSELDRMIDDKNADNCVIMVTRTMTDGTERKKLKNICGNYVISVRWEASSGVCETGCGTDLQPDGEWTLRREDWGADFRACEYPYIAIDMETPCK